MTNELKDIEEDVYKCSRCALCQSVCPVYKASLNECCVSKAKFSMLNGVIRGDLEFNSKIKEYLDLCTGCSACKEFCPSSIDAAKIFRIAKSVYHSKHKHSIYEKFVTSYGFFKFLLRIGRLSFYFLRMFNISAVFQSFKKILPKKLLLLDSLLCVKVKKVKKHKAKTANAVYFEGCFNKYLNQSSKNALKKVFGDLGIDLCEKPFECCGVSYLHDGNIKEFLKLAKKNLKLLKNDYDFLLTDCATCSGVLKEYKNYISSEQAETLALKTVNVLEFLKHRKIVSKAPMKVTLHKPCHETFDIAGFLKNIENVDYAEAKEYDECCGFGGTFALKFSDISKKISKKKAQNLLNTGAKIILTTCPACVLGINQGLNELQSEVDLKDVEVMTPIEFIAIYCLVFNA